MTLYVIMKFIIDRIGYDVFQLIESFDGTNFEKHQSKQKLLNIFIKYKVPYINHISELKINNISDTMV